MTIAGSRKAHAVASSPGPPGPGAETDATVRVWLFGALAALSPERPVELHFPAGFTARNAIEAMAERCGPALLDQVLCAEGSLLRYCRVFVNGLPVEDLDLPLASDRPAVEIEMILLMGYEGG